MDLYDSVCNLLELMYNQHKFLALTFLVIPLAIAKKLLTVAIERRILETLSKHGDNKILIIMLILVGALFSIN
ncbi:hypothetical protein Aeh1fORF02c [Aeromonas phage Aeh1]|uniref:Uncharacterized protein n=1 Tax=Aeromonas phage Aeh1 TaxID=2880362 RepID=Q76YW3_9CAUD|nr:hypothetical protein Aeh1p128 [Aeromonas phage Aeh1]AAQ17783.1 hypothetical protein Aeh1fORF02c [Aeromonas phage Aeh1]